jgi:hypothetical protein
LSRENPDRLDHEEDSGLPEKMAALTGRMGIAITPKNIVRAPSTKNSQLE